eukprot:scaffold231686_cov39-Attheya_sp.AAC.2
MFGMGKREVRNTIAAWYPMGYIPDLDQQSSSRKKTNYTKKRQGRGQRNYHRLIRAILKNSLSSLVMVKVETCFVAGRYGGYTTVWRISRACDCQQECCSNSDTECVYLLRVEMEEIFENTKSNDDDVAKQAKLDLHQLSQHGMELATSLLSFGGDKY